MKKNEKNTAVKPQIEIESIQICPTSELLGNESPDEEFVFFSEEGAESFLNFKDTYGFRFGVRFKAADEKRMNQAYLGPVSVSISTPNGKNRSYQAKYVPAKVWPCNCDDGEFYAVSHLFVGEHTEEEENYFENGISDASGSFELKGLVLMNKDYGVILDVAAEFRMLDGIAEISKENIKVKECGVLPVSELVEKNRKGA